MSVESLLFHLLVALQFSSMEHEIFRVKWAPLLAQNQMREIIMDSDSNEEKYYASEDMEDDEPCPPSRRSSISQPQPCLWTLPLQPWRCVVHHFIGAPNGKSMEAAHVTSEYTPLSILLLFVAEIITLLVVEMNHCYHQFLENSDDGPRTWGDRSGNVCVFGSDITDTDTLHTVQGRLEDYWMKMEQHHTPFYGQMMARARYYHILRFLHFTDNNRNGVDRTDDRLW
jgi:hypothetical protein